MFSKRGDQLYLHLDREIQHHHFNFIGFVKTYSNSLIIRTSFCEQVFPYEKAFIDQYTSRDYIDVIAPMILSTAVSNKKGVVHIGTHRKTVYDLAQRRSPLVGKIRRSDVSFNVPRDTSFK